MKTSGFPSLRPPSARKSNENQQFFNTSGPECFKRARKNNGFPHLTARSAGLALTDASKSHFCDDEILEKTYARTNGPHRKAVNYNGRLQKAYARVDGNFILICASREGAMLAV